MRGPVLVLTTIAVAFLGGRARAQGDTEASLIPPVLVQDVAPLYPEDAAAEGVHGPVALRIDIDTEGRVFHALVEESPDARLSFAALGAATRLRFSPARLGEAPVAVRLQYTLTFALKEGVEEREVSEDEATSLAQTPTGPVNFRGRVLVAAERLSVPGATVWVEGTELEAVTDAEGRFELRGVPAGTRTVHVEVTGFEPFEAEETFAARVLTEVAYYARRAPAEGLQTVIRGRKDRREVTKRVLTQQELRRMPGTFGDALRVVQRLPGVARSPFGLGAVVIRGGAPDDSAILIDGHVTRMLFHLGAGPSVVNSDVVEQLELYPGGFGVRFGRAHAGVVDVKTRDPNFETWSGAVTVDLLQTNFRLEGPMLGGAGFFAARRSYVAEVLNIGDVTARLVDLQGTSFTLAPRYSDYQAKLAWRMGGNQTISLNVMGAGDELDFALNTSELGPNIPERTGIRMGFHRVYPMWRYRTSSSHGDGRPVLRAEVSPVLEYSYSENRFDASFFRMQVPRMGLRAEAELRPIEPWGITVGTDNTAGWFFFSTDVPFVLPKERLFPRPVTTDPPRYTAAGDVLGTSLALYAQTDLELGPLLLVGGLRTDMFAFYDQVRTTLDPRLAARLEVLPSLTLKGNAGRYHRLPNPVELSASVGNPLLPTEVGWQYGFGVETWLSRSLFFDWQVFYRTLDRLPVPVRSPLAFDASGESFLQAVGEGRVYGSEVLLRQHLDKGLFGWVAYTLLRSERRSLRDDPSQWGVATLDQTHILSVAMSYQLPWGFELGGAVRYVTGNPQTPAAGGLYDADRGRYLRVNGPPLASRLPAFFQVDARVDKRFVFDTWALGLFLDVQNATNHQNFEFFAYSYDYSEVQGFPGLPLLPVFGVEASF
jgi:TonB family protein